MTYVLDTNIITAILKGNDRVREKAQQVIKTGGEIFINGISYYEIKRGLLAVNATTKLRKFDLLCQEFGLILLDTKSLFDEAAMIYADLRKKGNLIEDADILIAALTKTNDYTVVSDNTRHFERVDGLKFENWLK
jgi:tRNA(fMet)-specific endonuclease VapC